MLVVDSTLGQAQTEACRHHAALNAHGCVHRTRQQMQSVDEAAKARVHGAVTAAMRTANTGDTPPWWPVRDAAKVCWAQEMDDACLLHDRMQLRVWQQSSGLDCPVPAQLACVLDVQQGSTSSSTAPARGASTHELARASHLTNQPCWGGNVLLRRLPPTNNAVVHHCCSV